MAAKRRARIVALTVLLSRLGVDEAPSIIASGRVLVDGRVVTNSSARVRSDASIRLLPHRRLKGDVKLSFALDRLNVPVEGRVALDVGANAGGFTTALLAHGARRVYAVDAGTDQLRSVLRDDPRVVNLEGRNLGHLGTGMVPETIDIVTVDVSYLSLAAAIPQLDQVVLNPAAHLLALVKPTFELHRGAVASSETEVDEAIGIVTSAMGVAGWEVLGQCRAPMTGRRGARESFVLGRRAS